MATVEYDLDTSSSSIMAQIQALIAPPVSEDSRKLKRERQPMALRRPGRSINHDCCDSCKEGGDLLCCDRCPAAFHLLCHDPPLDEDELPMGEWVCHHCRSLSHEDEDSVSLSSLRSHTSVGKAATSDAGSASLRRVESVEEDELSMDVDIEANNDNAQTDAWAVQNTSSLPETQVDNNDDCSEEVVDETPLQTLIRVASMMNPKQFQLPNELQCTRMLPGSTVGRRYGGSNKKVQKKESNKTCVKKPHELDNGLVPLPAKLCFECRKSCRKAPLLQCDFCPLLFHQDCLDPPLTTLPTGRWMCPNHPEHTLDQTLLASVSLTERVKLWDRFCGTVSQNAVKIDFLKKVHRRNPPFRYKIKLPPRHMAQVPQAIRDHYKNRIKLLPKANESIETVLRPCARQDASSSTPTLEEQDDWLASVVSFQLELARHYTQRQISRTSENSNHNQTSNGLLDSCKTPSTSPTSASDGSDALSFPNCTAEAGCVPKLGIASANYVLNGDVDKGLPLPAPSVITNGEMETSEHESDVPWVKCKPDNSSVNSVLKLHAVAGGTMPFGWDKNLVCSSQVTNSSAADRVVKECGSPPVACHRVFSGGSEASIAPRNHTIGGKDLSSAVTKSVPPCKLNASGILSNSTSLLNFDALQTSVESDIDADLSKLDEKLIRILAWQRLQQLLPQANGLSPSSSSDVNIKSENSLPDESGKNVVQSRASLRPLNCRGQLCHMPYRVLSIGTSVDMDLCLINYGHCNFVSPKHACIFYDEATKHYELLNYSEHGITVDNVLYSCDFSDKVLATPAPASIVTSVRSIIDGGRGKKDVAGSERHNMSSQSGQTWTPCNCRSNSGSSNVVSGGGAGWEGTAILHHGSLIKCGCLHFVFSITESHRVDGHSVNPKVRSNQQQHT